MTEQQKKEEAKITVIEPSTMQIDERMIKAFEKIAESTFLSIQKRDYRATMVQRTEQGEVPSDVSTFVHINEDERDELDNPRELDIKGTITPYEANNFKDVNYAMALSGLKNWAYFEQDVEQRDGTIKTERVYINLAQIDMLSGKRLGMSTNGRQSFKHISALRAGAGLPQEEGMGQKAAGWFGWRKEKVSKQELDDTYGRTDKQ